MKIAGVQMDVSLGEIESNRRRIATFFIECRRNDADLTVFPECAVTGYCFAQRSEAELVAEPVPGPSVEFFANLCREHGGHLVVGMIERSAGSLYNVAVLIGPTGCVSAYRKVHLPFLGVDRFVDFGDRPFVVNELHEVRLGLNICYDSGFPEPSRVLALAGADLIVLPTNWPTGAEVLAEHAVAMRALENSIYYAAINRIGDEAGFRFIGRSRICDPSGRTLAVASEMKEEILYADIDVQRSREKTIVRVPGEHLINRIADRRPEFYERLTALNEMPRPGRDIPASRFR